jgi:two-component system osmolarity sensor histidine kinase EnvZ
MKIPFPFAAFLKRLMPESLFARAVLILVVPALLIQLVAVFVFYDRHWDNVTKYVSSSLSGEMALILHEVSRLEGTERDNFAEMASDKMKFDIVIKPTKNRKLPPSDPDSRLADLVNQLETKLPKEYPFSVQYAPREQVEARILLNTRELLILRVPVKRFAGATTGIFVMAMMGSALLLTLIATLFLRNQVRPIVRLSRAAEQFGRGFDSPNFKPHGALEVRRAGQSFVDMKERLQRLIKSRIEMLAGISHDLRTPITRMKLQLSMMEKHVDMKESAQDLKRDLSEMEHMITEYLDFAKGEAGEEPQKMNLNALISQAVEGYTRQGRPVTLATSEPIELWLKKQAFTRCVTNIIDNALRYGEHCDISVIRERNAAMLYFDDAGPGIPREHRELVFQAFKRLDPSRNLQTGGVGLGLTIVQDIVHGHGGEVSLVDAPSGGLRVVIELPL